jgi:hypothetical protein
MMATTPRCEGILPDGRLCQNAATHAVRVSTIPGSGDGKLITIRLCQECYDCGSWETADLSGNPWALTLREINGINGRAW